MTAEEVVPHGAPALPRAGGFRRRADLLVQPRHAPSPVGERQALVHQLPAVCTGSGTSSPASTAPPPWLRMPNQFTPEPTTRRPADSTIATWKECVEASFAAAWTFAGTDGSGRVSGVVTR